MSDDKIVNFTPSGKPVTHGGSGTAYANYGCRCEDCKKANSERASRRRRERYAEIPPDNHGKYSTYSNWGCRCPECKEAGKKHNANNYEARKAGKAHANA